MAFPAGIDVEFSQPEDIKVEKRSKGRPSFLCRRGHCPSFRVLLKRQIWSSSIKMVTSLGRIIRTQRSSFNRSKTISQPDNDEFDGTEDIFGNQVNPKATGAFSKITPSGSSLGQSNSSSPLSIRASPSKKKASIDSSSGLSISTLFKKVPTTTPMTVEPNLQHMRHVRSKRLMKEFRELTKQQKNLKEPMFAVDLVNDCLYEWKVKLYRIDPDSELARDMVEFNIPYILLNICFPENFPFQPPFLRVLAPKLEKGFVMEGGAICMELLTPRGWASAYTIEAILMQFASSLVKGQGRVSRKNKASKEFNKKSAESSFKSLVKTHDKYGWVTPPLAEG